MPKYRVIAGGLARVTRDERNRETERKHYSRGDVYESDADNDETKRYLQLGAIEEVDDETETNRQDFSGLPDLSGTGNDSRRAVFLQPTTEQQQAATETTANQAVAAEKLGTADNPEPADSRPYKDWEYSELQSEAAGRGLPATGSKPTLVQRLEEHDANQAATPADPTS